MALSYGENWVFRLKAKKRKATKKHKNKEGLGPSEVAFWATSPDPKPSKQKQKTKNKKGLGPSEVALWALYRSRPDHNQRRRG